MSIFFLIFIVGIFARSSSSSRQRAIKATWKKFASDSGLGITFERKIPFPKITGKYRELDYVLETVTESTGKKSIIYTVITIKLPECSVYNFHIYRENFFFNKREKIFGSEDIQTGNIRFDDVFNIKTSPSDKIDEVFTPDLQRKLLYGSYLINMTLSEKKLQNKTGRIIDNTQDLLYLSELMVEIAINVSGKDIISQDRIDPVLAEEKKIKAIARAEEERTKAIARAEEEKIKSLAQAEEDRIKALSELEERTLKALTHVEEKKIKDLFEKEKKSSEREASYKTFLSDFTNDFTDSSHKSSGEKQCPSCGANSPAEKNYCIDCRREI
ncbi:MAG: hypothetical protein ABRQ39_00020 [Candidatus Eremiobacterota bacterium]